MTSCVFRVHERRENERAKRVFAAHVCVVASEIRVVCALRRAPLAATTPDTMPRVLWIAPLRARVR